MRPTSAPKLVVFLLVALWALLAFLPVFTSVLGSLKTQVQIASDPLGLPNPVRLDNFARGWNGVVVGEPLSVYVRNTVLFSGAAVFLSTVIGSIAGYSLARSRARLSAFGMRYFLILFAVPAVITVIPLYSIAGDLGIRSNPFAIGVVYAAVLTPQAVVLMFGYFASFPLDLIDAARIDGAGELRSFRSVVLPLAKGSVLSVALLSFITAWNDLAYTLFLLVRPETKTIPAGLLLFTAMYSVDIGAQLAGMLIGVLPLVLAYVLMQRHVMEGLRVGAFR